MFMQKLISATQVGAELQLQIMKKKLKSGSKKIIY